jgi:hypothetical protein
MVTDLASGADDHQQLGVVQMGEKGRRRRCIDLPHARTGDHHRATPERHMAHGEACMRAVMGRCIRTEGVGFFLNTGDEGDACDHNAALAAFGATKKGGPSQDRP